MATTKVTSGGITDATIATADIADNAVTENKVLNGAVTSAKLGASAVGETKLATDAVTTVKIAGGAVTEPKLAANSINTAKIVDQAVTLAKLPHGTSSNDGKFLRANNGADPTFETVTGTTINNNADNRVITGSGTANTLNGESTFVYDTAENGVGIGISDPTPTASYYQGAFLHLHQAASGGNVGSQIHLTTDNTGSAAGDGTQISAYSSSLYINNQENGDTYFYNNGSSTFTIKADGRVGVNTQSPTDKLHVNGTSLFGGNTYITGNTYLSSNKGIYFDGGSNSASYLDDYEEGTWSPGINQGTANFGNAKYTKIGRFVNATVFVSGMSPRTSTQGIQITGLPFQANGIFVAPLGLHRIIGDQGNGQFGYVSDNTTYIDLIQYPWSQQGWKHLPHTAIQHATAAYIIITLSYQTD